MTDTHDGADRLDALRRGKTPPGPNTVDLSGLDDDLAELLRPYTWLGELKLGTMKSWSQDLFWALYNLAWVVQAQRGVMNQLYNLMPPKPGSGDER